MKITVFGATGGVGKHLVTQALQRGHAVNAVVRDAARLPISSPGLSVSTVPGLEEPTLLRPALRGSDAVLSAVGPRGRKTLRWPPPVPAASCAPCRPPVSSDWSR
ncbi:hypothetical protein NIIDMKKI_03100 [Mycobacterium kansasii]|uniref:NAD(P)-binding domain-containing protein n=1 Tax=Mycobacterium kansasii TaxID=1768 RepID=A0A7G1I3P3_MYCKA|nr:hypothetical protein NIIDMKKI_03100 [Mycobacterium kansasii]